jgi:hypothetical protein
VTTGALTHTLNHPNLGGGDPAGDYFGESVAVSGNYAIVGAKWVSDTADQSGKAYIFDVTTGALLHTLDNPNPYGTSSQDSFGYKVCMSGNYAVVGAINEDDVGANSGIAYIYNVTTGALLHTLYDPNPYGTSTNDAFGESIDMSETHVIVGAPYEESDSGSTGSGRAYIFESSSGTLIKTLDNPNAYNTSDNDFFGAAVAISGEYAVVGAYTEDDAGGTSSGKAYIFQANQ